jgi:hypothetical protein
VIGNADQGRAYVFSGTDGSLLLTLDTPNPQASTYFALSVTMGDVSGDGKADIAVGAAAEDVGGNTNQGRAYAFSLPSPDTDGDGVPDGSDLCPGTAPSATVDANGCSQGQVDSDGDGVCDPGASSPLWCTGSDNCPSAANPDQRDSDSQDGGDVCDPCPNDDTDTCDTDRSAAESIPPEGGTVTTPDGSVTITVPPGALPEDTTISITGGTDTDFELTVNLGTATGVYAVDIQPSGLVFNQPVTLVFTWEDADDDGWIDGTNVKEENIFISKDNVDITDRCKFDAGCDMVANTFTFTVSSLSEFVPAAPADSDDDGVFDQFDLNDDGDFADASELDNCPAWYNPGQELPPWLVPPDDDDCDGFDDTVESWVGTLPAAHCPATTVANDEDPDAWATDNNDDTWSKLDDVLRYIPVFNTLGPLLPAEKRYDLNADDKITLADVLTFIPYFNRQCT